MPPGSRWGLKLTGLHKAILDPIRRYLQRIAEADEASMQSQMGRRTETQARKFGEIE